MGESLREDVDHVEDLLLRSGNRLAPEDVLCGHVNDAGIDPQPHNLGGPQDEQVCTQGLAETGGLIRIGG